MPQFCKELKAGVTTHGIQWDILNRCVQNQLLYLIPRKLGKSSQGE
jgi:hypothetical protein